MSNKETIFALSTPPGKSAVAIFRVSGPRSSAALEAIAGIAKPKPNTAQYTPFVHPQTKTTIDKGLALFFAAPRSFTGEDMAEFHIHGSLAVIREMTEALAALGLRPAEPGEFSRRAFFGGKMDLIEAEGLADLIAAETSGQKAQALRQMEGNLSVYYEEIRARIVRALAHLEATIDFPDEEIPESALEEVVSEVDHLKSLIGKALQDNRRGERVRAGIKIVILGAPNVGKSSLLNALAGRDAAIVSHRAGTTRDVIEVHMDLAGYPVILSDTAGLRESSDEIEEEGVRRAQVRAEEADIRLLMFDAAALPQMDAVTQSMKNDNALIIINKVDISEKNYQGAIHLSAKTGEGMENLINTLKNNIITLFSAGEAPVITRTRHRVLMQETLDCLARFSPKTPPELACEELRLAARAVGKITGKIQVDDVLDVLFRQFCIGK